MNAETESRPATHGRLLVCLCDTCPNDSDPAHHGFCASCAVMGCKPRSSRCAPLNLVTEAMAKSQPRKARAPRLPKYKAESSPPATLPHGRRLASASDVYLELDDIKAESREHFVCFMLDVRHKVIARRVIAIGSMTGVEVYPRDTVRQAIVDGAAAVIFAHNHPSGDPSPSPQDVALTARLREVGDICGIVVLDHVVVSVGGFVSMSERCWK